jgi:hypothetical protein
LPPFIGGIVEGGELLPPAPAAGREVESSQPTRAKQSSALVRHVNNEKRGPIIRTPFEFWVSIEDGCGSLQMITSELEIDTGFSHSGCGALLRHRSPALQVVVQSGTRCVRARASLVGVGAMTAVIALVGSRDQG